METDEAWRFNSLKRPLLEGALMIPMVIASYPTFIGAWNMRRGTRYRWAYLAAVLASIPMLTPVIWCGIPLGIWALVVLHHKDVKAVFAARAEQKGGTRVGYSHENSPRD